MKKYIAHVRENDEQGQSVKDHLIGTACKAAEFAKIFGGQNIAYICGLLHDIGKYSDEFYKRIKENGAKCDHATAGAQKMNEINKYMADWFGYIVMGHHGGMPDYGYKSDCGEEGTFCARMRKVIPDYGAYRHDFKDEQFHIREFPELLSSMQIKIDGGFRISFLARMLYSCLVDADYLDTEEFMSNGNINRAVNVDFIELKKLLDERTAKFEQDTVVNRWRKKVLDDCIKAAEQNLGIFQLTVPTGGGKTIASASFAINHVLYNQGKIRRIIYVLPYCSIIEQNAKVFTDILGDNVVLEHHSSYDFEGKDDDYNDQKKLAAENWDMPFIVTTNAQFFESLYSNKTSKCRKLHNIAGSVIVFDEVQAIPTKYLAPCIRVIEELVENYNCSAMLCSATQPNLARFFQKEKPVYEIFQNTTEIFEALKRVKFTDLKSLTIGELANRVLNKEQVLVVLNTKNLTKQLFEIVKNENPENIFHLSTNMCPEHRRDVIAMIRSRLEDNLPCKVISTNLIEAGVDLDFQQVYRELAGLDAILQAAGRANRNGKRERLGEVYTFTFAEPEYKMPESKPYGKYIAVCRRKAQEIINKYDDIFSTKAVEAYFNALYDEIDEMWRDEKKILEKIKDFYIGGADFRFDYKEIDNLFKLIDEETFSVLVPYDELAIEYAEKLSSGHFIPTKTELRNYQKYIVSIRNYELERMKKGMVNIIDGNLAVLRNKDNYRGDIGLEIEEELGKGLFY